MGSDKWHRKITDITSLVIWKRIKPHSATPHAALHWTTADTIIMRTICIFDEINMHDRKFRSSPSISLRLLPVQWKLLSLTFHRGRKWMLQDAWKQHLLVLRLRRSHCKVISLKLYLNCDKALNTSSWDITVSIDLNYQTLNYLILFTSPNTKLKFGTTSESETTQLSKCKVEENM